MTWAVINITLSIMLATTGAYLIGSYGEKFNWLERTGISVQSGAAILRIGPILSRDDLVVNVSPYDDWSAALFVLGGLLAMLGIIARLEGFSPAAKLAVGSGEGRIGKWRHKRRNEAAKRAAERYLRERAKVRE